MIFIVLTNMQQSLNCLSLDKNDCFWGVAAVWARLWILRLFWGLANPAGVGLHKFSRISDSKRCESGSVFFVLRLKCFAMSDSEKRVWSWYFFYYRFFAFLLFPVLRGGICLAWQLETDCRNKSGNDRKETGRDDIISEWRICLKN